MTTKQEDEAKLNKWKFQCMWRVWCRHNTEDMLYAGLPTWVSSLSVCYRCI